MSEAIRFSVVIPVKNEEINIAKCLGSLARLISTAEPFEVIVVDNGSTDRTLEVVNGFCGTLQLIVLQQPGVFISAMRNRGAAYAKGTWLAFLDSDCEVYPNWLIEAQNAITSGCGSVFGSFYGIPSNSSWVARHWYGDRERKPRGETSFLPSGDLFLKSKVFEKIGRFNETIQTNEDVELCRRARAAGHPVYCVPELAVIHWGTPQTIGQFFKKNRWHGAHVLKVFLQNLPRLVNLKPLLFSFYMMLCLIGAGVSLFLALFERHYIPLLLAVLALLLPSCVLGIAAALKTRKLSAVAPMSVLFFIYGVARVASLLYIRPGR
jgi:glycosyltransferase involved in cell wall biosynthesis